MDATTISTYAAQLWATSSTETSALSNNNNETENDETNRFPRPLLTFAAVMTIIIMIVGIFGNLLTVVALIKCPKVRNVAAAFIISLCIADCIFCAIVLPFSAFRFILGTWTHGDFLCRLIPFIQYGNIGVSLLCIAMITINRYIMIAHHNSYAKIYQRHWIGIMIAFCWLFSYGMQLPTFFKVWGAFGFDEKLQTCSILKDQYGRSSKTALFVIAFLIPCLIIVGCYARIFWVVHKSEVRLRKHASKQNSIPNNLRQIPPSGTTNGQNRPISSPSIPSSSFSSGGGVVGGGGDRASIDETGITNNSGYGHNSSQKSAMRIKDQRDVKARRNEWRITKMVLAIFLSFIMCYLPITVIKVTDKDVKMPGFHIFGYIMLYLSSCINPIIYVIMNKQYRQAYKTVLMCKPTRLLPFTNAGSSVGEKWKDIGYSYNHSRTMVSQISIADHNSINQPQQAVIMELTNNNKINNSNNNNSTTSISHRNWLTTTSTPSVSNVINSNNNYNNSSNNNINNNNMETMMSQSSIMNTCTSQQQNSNFNPIARNDIKNITNITAIQASHLPQSNQHQQVSAQSVLQQQSTQMLDGPHRGIPITLAEDDVIVEEVESEVMEHPLQQVKDIPDNRNEYTKIKNNVNTNDKT